MRNGVLMDVGTYTPDIFGDELLQWLRDHFVDPRDVYRVDIGRRSVIVHRYRRSFHGAVLFTDEIRRPLMLTVEP